MARGYEGYGSRGSFAVLVVVVACGLLLWLVPSSVPKKKNTPHFSAV